MIINDNITKFILKDENSEDVLNTYHSLVAYNNVKNINLTCCNRLPTNCSKTYLDKDNNNINYNNNVV